MPPLVCQESWYEWPAKHWQDCFHYEITEVFPNWIDSLATGDATIVPELPGARSFDI